MGAGIQKMRATLDREGVSYIVVGSAACHRSPRDLDVVIEHSDTNARNALKALRSLGATGGATRSLPSCQQLLSTSPWSFTTPYGVIDVFVVA